MEFEYSLPDFKKYFPDKLIVEKDRIMTTWKNFEKYRKNTDIEGIILKVNNNKNISYEELEIVIYNLEKAKKIVEKNFTAKLYEILNRINIQTNEKRPVNAIEDIYVNLSVYFQEKELEKALKNIATKYIFDKKYNSNINKIFEEYLSSNLFFKEYFFLKLEKSIIDNKEYKLFIKKYNIEDTMEIFQISINRILFENIEKYLVINNSKLDNVLVEMIEEYFDNIEKKKECYKKVLRYYYINSIDFDMYSEIWMIEILNNLGEPNKNSSKWENIDEELIELVKKWLLKRELEKIFTINVRDKRRLDFWKQYVKDMEKVEYFENLNQAIVMETKKHTFIEFGVVGNAFYCYDIKDFNINLISIYEEKYNYAVNKILKEMKNQDICIIRETHSSRQWEMNFEYELGKLSYKLGENNNGHNW